MSNPNRGGKKQTGNDNHKKNNKQAKKQRKQAKKTVKKEVKKQQKYAPKQTSSKQTPVTKSYSPTSTKPKTSTVTTPKPLNNSGSVTPNRSGVLTTDTGNIFKVSNTSNQYKDFQKSDVKKDIDKTNKDKDKKPKKKIDWAAAVEKSNKASVTTGVSKKHTLKLKSKDEQKTIVKEQTKASKDAYYKSDEWKATKKELKKNNRKAIRSYLRDELGWSKDDINTFMNSEEGMKVRKDNYYANKEAVKKEINKEIKNNVKADVKKTYNLKYTDLNSEEFLKMQIASRMGKEMGDKYLDANQKGLTKKVGKVTAKGAYLSPAATGFMQGSGYGDIFAGSVGKYDKASREAIRETKSSGKYIAGYIGGVLSNMAIGQTGALGDSIASGLLKASPKVMKEGTKKSVKQMAADFGKRRAGEVVAETPINVMDAAKMSMDENGNIDRKEFTKWLALNTALTGTMGGATEGVSAKMTSKTSRETLELLSKQQAGTITKKESVKLGKNLKKLDLKANAPSNSLSKDISGNAKVDIKESVDNARVSRGKAKAEARQPKIREEFKNIRKEEWNRGLEREKDALARRTSAQKHADMAGATAQKVREKSVKTLTETKKKFYAELEKIQSAKASAKTHQEYNELVAKEEVVRASIKNIQDKLVQGGAKRVETKATREIEDRLAEISREKKRINGRTTQTEWTKLSREEESLSNELARRSKEGIKEETVIAPKESPASVKENANFNRLSTLYKARNRAISKGGYTPELQKQINALEEKIDMTKTSRGTVVDTTTGEIHTMTTANESEMRELAGKLSEESKAETKVNPDAEYNAKSKEDFEKTFGKEGGYASLPKEEEDILIKNPNDVESISDKEAIDGAFSGKKKTNVSDTEALKKFKIKMGKLYSFLRQWESSLKGFEHTSNVLASTARKTGNKELGALARKLKDATASVYLGRNRLAGWIEDGRVGADRKTVGKSLNQIYDDFKLFGKGAKQKQADFQDYLVYKHAIDRLNYSEKNPGKENYVHMTNEGTSQYTKEDYEGFIKEIESQYDKKELENFGKEMTAYYDDLMQYRVDMGLVSEKWAKEWKNRYPNYVPTMRDFEVEQGFEKIPKSVRSSLQSSVQTATGGTRPIQDLYSQTCLITGRALRNGEQNNLMNLYCEALGIFKGNVPKGTTVDDVAGMMINATKGKDGYSVTFFKDGKQVTMACDKQIALGLRELNGQDYTRLLHAGSKFGKVGAIYKAPITDYNILFGLRNGPRDMQQAAVNSKSIKHYTKAMPDAMECMVNPNNPYRKLYELNGGKYSALVKQGKGVKQPSKIGGHTYNPLKLIENANAAIEAMPRHCEFIGTLQKNADEILKKQGSSLKQLKEEITQDLKLGGKELSEEEIERVNTVLAKKVIDMADADVISNAIRNSAEVTLNFSRNGVFGRALNMGFMPYFNPSIQGLSKTIRMMEEDGLRASGNFFLKMGAITLTPAMINEILCVNNRDYQNLNARDKDMNFMIPLGDHKFLKIPKPRENAVLVEPAVYGLRHFFDTAEVGAVENGEYSGWEKLFKPMEESARTNLMPLGVESLGTGENLFSPLLRLAQNKTWYGGSIESVSDLISKEEQMKNNGKIDYASISDEKTSAIAVWLGNQKIGDKTVSDIMHCSPKKIDNLLDSYTGIIYDLGIANYKEMKDYKHPFTNGGNGNPVLNQFIKDSVFSNKNATELWAEYTKAVSPDDFKGKVEAAAKNKVFGNTRRGGFIKDKTLEAQRFLDQKGYDDMTYTNALRDKDLTPKQKRSIKIMRNDLDHDLVYGNKIVTSENDPIRKLSSVVGIDKAFKDYTFTYVDDEGKKHNSYLDAYNKAVKSGCKKKNFLDFYCDLRENLARGEENKSMPLTKTVCVQAVMQGKEDYVPYFYNKDTKKWYDEGLEDATTYKGYGFKQKNYNVTEKVLNEAAFSIGWDHYKKTGDKKFLRSYDLKDCEKFMALAQAEHRDGSFFIASHYSNDSKMSAARYLTKKGYTMEQVSKMANKYGLTYISKKSGNTPEEVMNAIDNSKFFGDKPEKVKRAVYHLFGDYGCKWGDQEHVGQKNDTGIMKERPVYSGWGYGGHRRGWHRWGGHGGWGGGGNSTPKTTSGSIKKTKVKDVTFDSNLSDAYRKKLKKLRKEQG